VEADVAALCRAVKCLPACLRALSARPASPRQLVLVCPADAALPAVLQAPVLLEAMSYRSGHHSTSDDSSRWVGQAGGWMDGWMVAGGSTGAKHWCTVLDWVLGSGGWLPALL
jgi:hypothetical protein